MINKQSLFEYVKDHLEHFGFFPADFEDIQTEEVVIYPDYMYLFDDKQTNILMDIFKNHPEYIQTMKNLKGE